MLHISYVHYGMLYTTSHCVTKIRSLLVTLSINKGKRRNRKKNTLKLVLNCYYFCNKDATPNSPFSPHLSRVSLSPFFQLCIVSYAPRDRTDCIKKASKRRVSRCTSWELYTSLKVATVRESQRATGR